MSLAQVCKAAREKTGEKPIHAINAAKCRKDSDAHRLRVDAPPVSALRVPRRLLQKRSTPFSGESPLTLPAQKARGMIIYFIVKS